MRGVGGQQLTAALLLMPRLNGKATLAMLPVILRQSAEKELYKSYIAECLRLIGENTAKEVGGNYMTNSYTDLVKPKKEKSADEIVKQVIADVGLVVI